MKFLLGLALVATATAKFADLKRGNYKSEIWTREQEDAAGIVRGKSLIKSPLPETYTKVEDLPAEFTWCNNGGTNYCTISRNQHIPQYCGSCWAHGAISALGDRIKIARKAQGIDINLSVQHLLNCGNAGSCMGGSLEGPYQWIADISKTGTGISYETANPYVACSSDSKEGFCGSFIHTLYTRQLTRFADSSNHTILTAKMLPV